MRGVVVSTLLYVPAYAVGLKWGILGVATGHLVATAVMNPIAYRLLASATGIRLGELWDALSTSVVGSAIMAAALAPAKWALKTAGLSPVPTLVLLVGLGVVVYGTALWLVQRQAVLGLVNAIRDALPRAGGRLVGSSGEAT
jgi:ABC-type uncharacterized transport system permease subunit